jgi:hypothetical protein
MPIHTLKTGWRYFALLGWGNLLIIHTGNKIISMVIAKNIDAEKKYRCPRMRFAIFIAQNKGEKLQQECKNDFNDEKIFF